jgi:hypothetical protein
VHAMRFRAGPALTALRRAAPIAGVLIAAVLVLTALMVPGAAPAASAAPASASAAAASASAASGGCHEVFQPPNSWVVVCGNGSSSGGGSGSGGGRFTCSIQLLSKAQIKYLGLPPPPKGEHWAAITCPGKQPFGGVTLVSRGGRPAVTPQELMEVARSELKVPVLRPATAPPLHRKGLVGLPEWYWIPHGWRPISVTVTAGPVWATVTATPVSLAFDAGGGQPGSSCSGPGVPYRRGGHTGCSYTYTQSSATQPGGKYAAAVTVTWRVSWKGSGGTGGMLDSGLQIAFPFSLRIAEGQALVTGTGVGQ